MLVVGFGSLGWSQTPTMIDRFDFWNNSANDVVGSATLYLVNGATISGGALNLGGGGQYATITGINSGNGVSALSAVSFEGWGTYSAATGAWSRLFDFGATDGSGLGYDYIGATVAAGGVGGPLRAIFTNADPGYSNETDASATSTGATGNPVYTVVTFDGSTNVLSLYMNGNLAATNTAPSGVNLAGISNQYAYLGKSLYNNDSPLNGSISEFRVWNGALSPAMVAANALAGPTGSAQLATWNGNGTFTNAANWDIGVPNDPVNTSIVVSSGSLAVASPTTSNFIGTTILSGAEMSVSADNQLGALAGQVSLSGGALQITGATPFTSARNITLTPGNNGTIDVENSAGATLSGSISGGGNSINGGSFLYLTGSGALTLTGVSTLGTPNAGGTGIGGTHLYLANGALVISGTGSLTADGTWQDIGSASGNTVSMTLRDSGSFITDNDVNLGDGPVSGVTATVTVQDNALLQTGSLYVGKGPNTGLLNILGGSVAVGGRLVVGASGTGSVTQTGGNVLIQGGESRVGGDDNGTPTAVGTYTISNGTLTADGNFQVGAEGTGTFTQTGGVVNSGGWHSIGRFAGGVGVQTITAGIFNQTNTGTHLIVGEQGTGTLTVSGSGLVNCVSDLWIGLNYGGSPGNGTVNLLSGGTIATSAVAGQGGTATFNFNGGTLLATSNNGSFMQALTAANVENGGAVIDSNGQSIAIGQALLASGTGGLTKIGAGTLSLTGLNTYTGPTTVNAGALLIAGTQTSSSGFEVKSGATLGGYATVSALTVDAGGTVAFNLSNNPSAGNDQITVTGNLDLAAGTIINISSLLNGSLGVGTYDLISAPSNKTPIPSGALTLTGLPAGTRPVTLDYSSPTAVNLDVSAGNLVWVGGQNGNAWDVKTTKNWNNDGAADYFYNLDNVTFNDSGSNNGVVNVVTNVQPGSVTFSMSSASIAYTLTGTGSITGATGLVTSGLGTLTVSNPNRYSGETDIQGGTVNITSSGALGDGSGANATNIAPNAGETAVVTVSGGTLAGSPLNVGGGGNGTLTQSGNSVIAVKNANTYIGANAGAMGLYTLQGGTLNTGDLRTGVAGSGEFDQSGGVANVNWWFRVGEFTGSSGTVNMTGGTLNIGNNNGMRLNVGEGGAGTMNIANGQITVGGPVMIGGQSWDGQASSPSGVLNISGSSSLAITTGDWFMVGFSGGQGTMNISGGTVTTGGEFHIGDGNGNTGSNGTVNQSGNSFVNVYNPAGKYYSNLYLGINSQGTGIGVYNLSGGTLSTWDVRAGVDGTGTFNQTGGVVNVNGWLRLGELTGSTGVYNLSAGTVNANLMCRIGEESGGTMNISGNAVMNVAQDVTLGLPIDNNSLPGTGTLNMTNNALVAVAGGFYPGNGGGTGTVNIGDNASIQVTGGGNFDIGDSTGGAGNLTTSGTVNQMNGTISLAGGQFWVSNGALGNGVYNMSGGVLNVANWIAVGRLGGTGVMNMSGGTINKTGGGNIIVGSLSGNGTWNMNGGLVLNNSLLLLGENANSGTFYLNSGTVQATGVGNNGGTGNLYFNGGVLQASAANANFFSNSSNGTGAPNVNYYIQAGGAIIDSNGNDIAITNALAPDPALVGTDGGLQKNGAGTLALTGPNTYAGPTTVNAGTLLITGNPTMTGAIEVKAGATLGGDTVVSAVTVDKGATLAPGYTFTNPLQTGNFQPASLTTSASAILAFKLSSDTSVTVPPINDQITVAGDMELAAGTIINVNPLTSNLVSCSLADGTYNLISASSNTTPIGASALTLFGSPPLTRQTITLDTSSPTAVNLIVSGTAANLVWTGSHSNVWDVKTTQNWSNGGTPDVFYNLDNVAFNDTGIANNIVSIPANVAPGSVTVNLSSASAYTLQGAGGITGATGLVMSGAGTLTVSTPNTYTGETDIHAGTVVINAGGSLGDHTLVNAFNIASSASDAASVASVTVSGTLFGNTLNIGQVGAGTLSITGGQVAVGSGGVNVAGAGGNSYLNVSGSGSLTASGILLLGSSGTGTITQNGGYVLIQGAGGESRIGGNDDGASTAVGTYTISNGTLTVNGNFQPGAEGSGSLIQTGGVVNSGGWHSIGRFPGGVGVQTISGGTFNQTNPGTYLIVGEQGTGTLMVSGTATVNCAGGLGLGWTPSGTGTVTQSGGNVLVQGGGDSRIGGFNAGASTAVGVYEISNGTLTVDANFQPGAYGTGTLIQTGGVVNSGEWHSIGRFAGGVGVQTISGGTFNQTNPGTHLIVGEQGTGTLNVSGSGLVNCASDLWIGLNYGGSPGNGTVNLSGGTIATSGVAGQGGTATFYFNGGTLLATANNGAFLQALTAANIQAGWATINTNGNNITIGAGAVLAPDPALTTTDGGLTKIGAGWLTLTGTNTYAGGTTINAGLLQVNSDAALGAVPANEQVNITINNGGELYNDGGQLNLSANRDISLGSGTQYIEPGWGPSGIAVNGRISGSGGLAVAWDGGVLTLNNSNSYHGSTTIGTTAGPFYWNSTAANVTLQLGSANALPGTDLIFGSDANNNTATLDLNGFSATVGGLTGGTNAVVDDITAGGTLRLTAGNNNASGTFSGSIRNTTGTVALDKIGTGTLVLSGTDSYSGGTTVSAGTLVATSNTALPGGTSLIVSAGGTFIFDPGQAGAPVAGPAASSGVAAVPEPDTLVLLAAGAVLAAFAAWRRRRN